MDKSRHFQILLSTSFLTGMELNYHQNRTITGTVINGLTGKPVSGIIVELKGVEEKGITDLKGEYSITIPDGMQANKFADFTQKDMMEMISDFNIRENDMWSSVYSSVHTTYILNAEIHSTSSPNDIWSSKYYGNWTICSIEYLV